MDDNGGVDSATYQINDRHYADLFAASNKLVKCVALEFSKKTRGLKEWKVKCNYEDINNNSNIQ